MNSVIKDTLAGAIMFGGLSYLSERFKSKTYYFKIVAFVWAAPFTYFYLLYIPFSSSNISITGSCLIFLKVKICLLFLFLL